MKRSYRVLFFACSILLLNNILYAQANNNNRYDLIPYPSELAAAKGSFTISKKTVLIIAPGAAIFANEQQFLHEMLQNYLGTDVLKQKQTADTNAIVFKYDATITGAEAYRLVVSDKLITLSAKYPAGMFYAIETLRQLLPASVETGSGLNLPVAAVTISDKPAFEWRGMMLDVSRHFFSISYLKKYADMMALYKLNKLHIHLTDDEGWRIEIKKYPALTQIGAWRVLDRNDSACIKRASETGNTDFNIDQEHIKQVNGKTMYGGFYTQEEMKAFINYAASRHVEVIPEIDMPGHMKAAVSIFPFLTCDSSVITATGFSNPICPCNDKAIDFAKDIFSEITSLFPSKYIHIGGDEVDKTNWENSPVSRAFMHDKGFTKPAQLQSYFNDLMVKFFQSKGKTMIGWDEIIEGGVGASPVVMFWRPWATDAPSKATANGNKVIMTPDGPLYFDAIPDNHSLQNTYNYNPFDSIYHLNKNNKNGIIGVQANLWAEMVPSEKRADYLVFPRLTALAELGWTHRSMYAAYMQRLNSHYPRLDNLQVNYRLPDIEGTAENNVFVGKTSFFKSSPAGFKLHYTLDGSIPQITSPVMEKPLDIDKTTVVTMALFTQTGRRGDVYNLHFNAKKYAPPLNISNTTAGLNCEFYDGSFALTTAISGAPGTTSIEKEVAVPKAITAETFGLKFTGFINVPQTGIYTFYLNSDDGGVLLIEEEKIIDNDGLHPAREKGGQAALEKGLHAIGVNFIDGGGGNHLELRYSTGNSAPIPIPTSWFSHSK